MVVSQLSEPQFCVDCGEVIKQGDLAIRHIGVEELVWHVSCAQRLEQRLSSDLEEAYRVIMADA